MVLVTIKLMQLKFFICPSRNNNVIGTNLGEKQQLEEFRRSLSNTKGVQGVFLCFLFLCRGILVWLKLYNRGLQFIYELQWEPYIFLDNWLKQFSVAFLTQGECGSTMPHQNIEGTTVNQGMKACYRTSNISEKLPLWRRNIRQRLHKDCFLILPKNKLYFLIACLFSYSMGHRWNDKVFFLMFSPFNNIIIHYYY